MNDYTFGEYLYQKRKQSGDSQNELVEKLGVTGKAVSKWENGSAVPDLAVLDLVAKAMEVNPFDLVKFV